jgi:hypothetical protein
MQFADALWGLREGRLSFDEFALETRGRWTALAAYVARRWRLPAWGSTEDLHQELLLGAWEFVWRFEPCVGTRIDKFVVFNAVDKAKKAAHRMRGASLSGSADRNASRIEKPLASFTEEGERAVLAILQEEADQVHAIERTEAMQHALSVCRTPSERKIIETLIRTGSLLQCALALYEDPATRLDWRMNNEDHARRLVIEAAQVLEERLRAA